MTKKYNILKKLFLSLSLSSTFLPLIVYTIKGFSEGQPSEKFTLGCLATISIIICIINVMLKIHLKSSIWLLLLGVYVCLKNITTLLIIIAICTILDELVFTPLFKKYKNLYIINREIDKR